MMIGTLKRAQVSMSCISLSFDACTIWLTAKGATFSCGCAAWYAASSVVMCSSHTASCSLGRAFSAGNEPTMPALHWAITSSGVETMNIGEPITGRVRWPSRIAGMGMAGPDFLFGLQPETIGKPAFRLDCVARPTTQSYQRLSHGRAQIDRSGIRNGVAFFRKTIALDQCFEPEI